VAQLTKFGGALAIAGGAVKVATDAFMQNESNVDSWGRTVEATGSIYQSFLQSLNNSDFSGFLSGIGRVIQAAKDAYNAMDELNTRMTIINPERAKLQARQTQLKATIRRKGADSAEGKAAQDELKKMEPQLVKSYQAEAKMNRDAFAAALRQRLAEGNIKVSESEFGALLSTFSDDRKFRQFRANAKGSKGTKVVGSAYSDSQQIIEYDTRNKNQRIAELITDEWRQKYSPYLTASYNAQGQAYSTLLGDARYVRAAKGDTGGGTGRGGKGGKTNIIEEVFPEGSMKDLQRDMQELKKAQDLVTSPDEWQKYQQQIDAVTEKMNTLKGVVK
jgi:ubiquinone biosynthesis protein UbiJ